MIWGYPYFWKHPHGYFNEILVEKRYLGPSNVLSMSKSTSDLWDPKVGWKRGEPLGSVQICGIWKIICPFETNWHPIFLKRKTKSIFPIQKTKHQQRSNQKPMIWPKFCGFDIYFPYQKPTLEILTLMAPQPTPASCAFAQFFRFSLTSAPAWQVWLSPKSQAVHSNRVTHMIHFGDLDASAIIYVQYCPVWHIWKLWFVFSACVFLKFF